MQTQNNTHTVLYITSQKIDLYQHWYIYERDKDYKYILLFREITKLLLQFQHLPVNIIKGKSVLSNGT